MFYARALVSYEQLYPAHSNLRCSSNVCDLPPWNRFQLRYLDYKVLMGSKTSLLVTIASSVVSPNFKYPSLSFRHQLVNAYDLRIKEAKKGVRHLGSKPQSMAIVQSLRALAHKSTGYTGDIMRIYFKYNFCYSLR